MAERPAAAFAFVDCAARWQSTGARLSALVETTERELAALVGRCDALPAAATFDPFAAVLPVAAAAAEAGAAGVMEAASRRRAAALAGVARPRTQVALPEAVPPAGRAPTAAAIDRGAARDPATGLPVGARTHAAALPFGRKSAAMAAPVRAFAPTPAGERGAPVRASSASAAPLAPLPATLVAVADATAAVRAVEAAFGRLADVAAPTIAALPGGVADAALAMPLLLAGRLARIAGVTADAADMPALRSAAASKATPAAPPAPAAPRAPARLLGGAPMPTAPGALATAIAEPPAAAVRPAAPADPPAPDEDDLVAAISRHLVDQAWLRGVDLS